MSDGLARPPERPRRIVFCGTPAAAVPSLQALADSELEVVAVLTRGDARRGRRAAPTPAPVKAAAIELGLPVVHELADLDGLDVDLGVVVAYGRIVPRRVLERLPMVNLHFSLLPRWRGAAPVERALLAGDSETGVCVMGLEEGLDTGPVHSSIRVPIGPTTTAVELTEELAVLGARLLVDTLTVGLGEPRPQVGEPTHAAKVESSDRRLDPSGPAARADRVVRIGGAWTTVADRRLVVVEAEPVDDGPPPGRLDGVLLGFDPGALRLVTVKPEGRAAMAAEDWARGARLEPGTAVGA